MKKNQLWDQYLKQNPQFGEKGENVTLSTAGLKKLFDTTWKQAQNTGFDAGIKFGKEQQAKIDPLDFFKHLGRR